MKSTEKSQAKNLSSISDLFREYHKSHINRTNQLIHYVCVPTIFWSISAMLWGLKLPIAQLNMAIVILGMLLLYYLAKNLKVFVVMAIFSLICLALNYWLETLTTSLTLIAFIVFIIAWIGQFIGHHIEGTRPSFFKDLQFLLIGPAWVIFKLFNMKI
ncbi:MAG: DUF962 domain-containing protein [Proteobacteria bacterium]|nr:DUF962 domain-containing protein [Pseudomonadota bacterium]